MTYHRRKRWTSVPAANANRVVRSRVRGVAIHWNGPKVPLSALKDPRRFLEGVRRYHVHSNGWSDIAYNVAVDQNGDVWQLRGFGYQSAANGSAQLNDEYLAIFCVLGEGQVPSEEMVRGIRKAVRRFRLRYPFAKEIVGHGDIRPGGTACPGPALARKVKAGKLRPWRRPKPQPPAPVCNQSCPVHCPKEK